MIAISGLECNGETPLPNACATTQIRPAHRSVSAGGSRFLRRPTHRKSARLEAVLWRSDWRADRRARGGHARHRCAARAPARSADVAETVFQCRRHVDFERGERHQKKALMLLVRTVRWH
jgi:hypothetical protein